MKINVSEPPSTYKNRPGFLDIVISKNVVITIPETVQYNIASKQFTQVFGDWAFDSSQFDFFEKDIIARKLIPEETKLSKTLTEFGTKHTWSWYEIEIKES